jgi:peptide-methionine (S)-S-oxide reductase
MIRINIPGFRDLQLIHLVLDYNGTLALDGKVLPGVGEALTALASRIEVHGIKCLEPSEQSMKRISFLAALSRIAAFLLVIGGVVHAATQSPGSTQTAKATFAGGCFWCMEPPYDEIEGVISTTSGYIGGTKKNPTYEQVSAGTTGHAEAVQVAYDPNKVSYQKLLDVFWRNIDPLTADAQFCDSGRQYRSAIFYHDEAQKALAEKSKNALQARFKKPIVTEIVAATEFYPAEDYHQDYYKKNPIRYKIYRYGCGRDQRLKELWGSEKTATH